MLSPLPVAPVNETDMVLLPDGLKALKRVAKTVGLDLRGAYLNLDAGFDSTHNRKCIFNTGMIPNIKANPRQRKRPKRGRKRFFEVLPHVKTTRRSIEGGRCGHGFAVPVDACRRLIVQRLVRALVIVKRKIAPQAVD
jgi:hypothetical protein